MNTYDSAWKKIDQLIEKKGLPKSALAEVQKIYDRAKKEKNNAQLIKALIYKFSIPSASPDGNTEVEQIKNIEKEIISSTEPAKQILQSITAEMYWLYFQNNRWKFYDRSNTAGFSKEDIATWTIDDLHQKISELYTASLENEKLLQQTKLETYEPIIVKGNMRKLRPTLYDLLAHRTLDYFENDERDITKPAYSFAINENAAFDPVADFIHHKFVTKDITSLQYKALLIYQQLLSFHSNDATYEAITDADLRRLRFVYSKSVVPQKDNVYQMALNHIIAQYGKQPVTAQPWYVLAQFYFDKGMSFDKAKGDDAYKDAFKKSKDICETVINNFPKTEGAANCQNLLSAILNRSLTLQTEKINVPGEAFRTLISYKNFTACNFRIIKLDKVLKEQLQNRDDDTYWTKLSAQQPTAKWVQQLPVTDDYREHAAEIKIDALPVGEYALLASVNNDFSTAKNLLAVQFFYVSAISYINNGNTFFALHRTTGKPLQAATIQVWTSKYDYTDRKNKLQKAELLSADKNGFFTINTKGRENQNARLEINWQKDHLFMDDYQYLYTRYNADDMITTAEGYTQNNTRVYFFTDRGIYRPGQTVYFKGLALTKNKDTRKAEPVTNKEIEIYLQDENRQVIDSVTIKLNEYGSVHGQFRLPQNVLTGNFSILVKEFNQSAVYFSVEEYKRPKFFVELKKPAASYRVNDTVSITGFAKAYAGNNIDGASVKYRVSRQARFIYPWLYYKRGIPSSSSMEITSGITTTDAEGKFGISFNAIPDLTIDKSLDPVFDYTIEADITDINGETRSSTTIVQVGYKAVNLAITLPQNGPLTVDSFKTISITAANLNGEPETVKATVKICPLQSAQRLIRSRYWEKPDQFVYSEEEFIKYFPHDEYKDEADYRNWKKGATVFTDTLTTGAGAKIQLTTTGWQQGWYMIEVTSSDRYGEVIKAVEYIQLFDIKSKTLAAPSYNWQTSAHNIIQPGETAEILSGTSAADVFLIQQIDRTINNQSIPIGRKGTNNKNENEGEYQFFTLSNEKKKFSFTATEDDRGGYGVAQFFVKDNRFYSNSNVINIPWTNKQLTVSFSTFRDKVEPGSQEKWQVKISGDKGEKVVAEMLASMYDASLDQFRPHGWSVPPVWPQYYAGNLWNGRQSFLHVQSQERNTMPDNSKYYEKNYDRLMSMLVPQIRMDKFTTARAAMSEVVVVGYGRQKKGMRSEAAMAAPMANAKVAADAGGMDAELNDVDAGINMPGEQNQSSLNNSASVRTNFNETAFFFPDLTTDSLGNISFGFTMPEALTQWKLMTFAHTKELSMGYAQQFTVTQKELMVQPNMPRFVREKDSMSFSAKVVNLSDKLINGFAKLELINAATNEPVDNLFHNAVPVKNFAAAAGQSISLEFLVNIPENFNVPLIYRISARSSTQADGKELADGEENALPVLTNRMLLTESLPLNMKSAGTRQFKFEKLLKADTTQKSSLRNYSLTVEFTANPAWYAVQALPYLAEFPYECAEQTFNRYYANTLASAIANSAPRLKAVFDKWRNDSAGGKDLSSPLQRNEELKSILLQETPWVVQAQNETEQKKNIALLFDMLRLSNESGASFNKLKDMQASNGGFVWFKGGSDDRYITQYIITGIGHLQQLKALPKNMFTEWNEIINNALNYADERIKEDYNQLVKNKADLKKNNLSNTAIQYLYMRSFFPDRKVNESAATAFNYYSSQVKLFWLKQSRYMQGMIALSLFRNGDRITPKAILSSLKENSTSNEEMGMYWKDNRWGYYWYEAPVEVQALLIEAFGEIAKDTRAVNDMKLWLLKQKQTQHWGNTKATAEACYALLLQGTDWLANDPKVDITLGKTMFSSAGKSAEGTGYFKNRINAGDINTAMGNIKVVVTNTGKESSPSWGAVYWQYFEDLDKITSTPGTSVPLQLTKKLFVEKNTDKGPVLYLVNNNNELKVGDKLKVRIELRADRDMEYVHMKDLRAAGTEPVNVLSQYKWQGGLGYYESTKDAATNFFFSWLQKGTYVFEYPLFVTHQGNFSTGVATIQCMYAPEFASHSEGVRINVK